MICLTDAQEKYQQEPKFKEFVDWFSGLIQSGGLNREYAIYAAILAADIAENKRRNIPGNSIPAGMMLDGTSKLLPTEVEQP